MNKHSYSEADAKYLDLIREVHRDEELVERLVKLCGDEFQRRGQITGKERASIYRVYRSMVEAPDIERLRKHTEANCS
jgi:hypothetical protein